MNVTTQRIAVLLVFLACSACADNNAEAERAKAEAEQLRLEALERKSPETVELPSEGITGEVPAGIMAMLRKDLEDRGIDDAASDPVAGGQLAQRRAGLPETRAGLHAGYRTGLPGCVCAR